jgi:hypothetical protein
VDWARIVCSSRLAFRIWNPTVNIIGYEGDTAPRSWELRWVWIAIGGATDAGHSTTWGPVPTPRKTEAAPITVPSWNAVVTMPPLTSTKIGTIR